VFKRNGWWWIDYYDADRRRHRKKAAPDYQTATLMYREVRQQIAKGVVLGVRDDSILARDFVEKRYWPNIRANVSYYERLRARTILDKQILPRFGGLRLSVLRTEHAED
jgi:hypothetical protein